MGVALIGLSLLGELPWWVTVVILVREIGVTLLRFWVIRHGVIAAGRGGKAQDRAPGARGVALPPAARPAFLATVRAWVMAAALVVTVVTGAHYVVKAVRLRRTSERALAKRAAAGWRRERPRPRTCSALAARLVLGADRARRDRRRRGVAHRGLVASTLVDVPGVSAVLRGGVVAYATDLKASLLGVDADLLAGSVRSTPTWRRRWPRACAERLAATYGLATTGRGRSGPAGRGRAGHGLRRAGRTARRPGRGPAAVGRPGGGTGGGRTGGAGAPRDRGRPRGPWGTRGLTASVDTSRWVNRRRAGPSPSGV